MTFTEFCQREMNYTPFTTFWTDFSIADKFGASAVKDTFDRAFYEWKGNYKYLVELIIVLNIKSWMMNGQSKAAMSELYANLYYTANDYAADNLKGEEAEY